MPMLPPSVFRESGFTVGRVSQFERLDGSDCWNDIEEFVHRENRIEAKRGVCVKKSDGFIANLAAYPKQTWSNVKVIVGWQRVDPTAFEM
jgi:hypothetical protein